VVEYTRTLVLTINIGKSASLVFAAVGDGVGWLRAADADRRALPSSSATYTFAKRHGATHRNSKQCAKRRAFSASDYRVDYNASGHCRIYADRNSSYNAKQFGSG
jgi:hypothetical protein